MPAHQLPQRCEDVLNLSNKSSVLTSWFLKVVVQAGSQKDRYRGTGGTYEGLEPIGRIEYKTIVNEEDLPDGCLGVESF